MKNPFNFNISYSLFSAYKGCQRQVYYSAVAKYTPEEVMTAYGDAGSIVHTTLENTYFSPLDEAKKLFEELWTKKNLDTTNKGVRGAMLKKEQYWDAVMNGIQKKYDIVMFEQKLQFNDFFNVKGYIDAVVDDKDYTNELIEKNPDIYDDVMIVDWKTNTNADEGLAEQLKFYCYLWYRKYKKIPKRCRLDFVKINKQITKTYEFKDVVSVANDIKKFIDDIMSKKKFSDWTYNTDNCFFCGYKQRCANDMVDKDEETFELVIKNSKVYVTNPTNEQFNELMQKYFSYEVDNASFIIASLKRKGIQWDGIARLYKSKTVPIGLYHRLIKTIYEYEKLSKKRILINVDDRRKASKPKEPLQSKLNNVDIRWYQDEAVSQLMRKQIGIISVPTSGGKTVIAAEMYRRNPVNTLFVVDRKILLTQTVKEFENVLNTKCSTIVEGQMNIDSNLVVATIQTINAWLKVDKLDKSRRYTDEELEKLNAKIDKQKKRKSEMTKFLKSLDNVIIDEAHIGASESYTELTKKCSNASMFVGLTGTPGDGRPRDLELYKNIGEVEYEIPIQQLIDDDVVMKPKIKFLKYDDPILLEGEYSEIYDQIIEDETRNTKIVDLCETHNSSVKLILVNKIRHGQLLQELLEQKNIKSKFIRGAVSNDERETILDNARNGDTTVLIGTSSIVSKGMNLKSLEVVINATANATSIMTIQSLGRVLRKKEGKDQAIFYDFYDTCKYLMEHTEERIKAFEKQGHEVEFD